MSKSTISTFQLFEMIPDAETARLYLVRRMAEETLAIAKKVIGSGK